MLGQNRGQECSSFFGKNRGERGQKRTWDPEHHFSRGKKIQRSRVAPGSRTKGVSQKTKGERGGEERDFRHIRAEIFSKRKGMRIEGRTEIKRQRSNKKDNRQKTMKREAHES